MTHAPSYDELRERLALAERDVADWKAERLAFAARLLRWLRDGNDATDIGLAEPGGDAGGPYDWWAGSDAEVTELVGLFDAEEVDTAVHAAEQRTAHAYER